MILERHKKKTVKAVRLISAKECDQITKCPGSEEWWFEIEFA